MTTSVDNAAVSRIIEQSISAESHIFEDITLRIGRAFRKLQWRRRHVEPANIQLAAAEHYMYSRFIVGITGDPLLCTAPRLYGIKPRPLLSPASGQSQASTIPRTLPPADDVERWGIQGATHGLMDHTAVHGKTPDQFEQTTEQTAPAPAAQAFHFS